MELLSGCGVMGALYSLTAVMLYQGDIFLYLSVSLSCNGDGESKDWCWSSCEGFTLCMSVVRF